MHHHGYLWCGPKQRFDDEALRRPPHPDPPPGDQPDRLQRYREAVTEFPRSEVPPMETAYWLVKPRAIVQGTWREPVEAARWLGERLAEYTPRFHSRAERDGLRLPLLVTDATQRLGWGGDISLGFYLERPSFLALALVTCSPNRARPELICPTA
ncbi:hypothetical protein ACFVIM_22170 [Streptomyces sp. NPDC057638]|uniref:hypothetical protein n=1 Tax=Streptomyces sp. NPDC057638 TaxID=3346190 RepID=UPI003674EF00